MNLYKIVAERNSPSDEEFVCITLKANAGGRVSAGDVVAEMEGAKAIFEVVAGRSGFFYPLLSAGQRVKVGRPIGIVSQDLLQDYEREMIETELASGEFQDAVMSEEKSTMSAAASRLFHELDESKKKMLLKKLENYKFVREEDLKNLLSELDSVKLRLSQESINGWKSALTSCEDFPKIVFIGGGYGALQVLDVILATKKFSLKGYFSDSQTNVLDEIEIPRLGKCMEEDYLGFLNQQPSTAFVVTVGTSPTFRFEQISILKNLGANLPNLIHPSTIIGNNCIIGVGNIIYANVHVGADTQIGDANLISSNSTIEHHNILGTGNTFGPLVATSGNVKIGDRCKFGSSVIVEPKIIIGSDVTIASNSTITTNIEDENIVKLISNVRISKKKP